MKAVTLTAPYGTLIAIAATRPGLGKRIETRSWATAYRGPLAIHQAKGLGPVGGKKGFYDLCYSPMFLPVLEPAMTGERDIAGFKIPHIDPGYLPLGAIVATCELLDCAWIGYDWPDNQLVSQRTQHHLTDQERAFGDYTPGRYAWLLANIRALETPIPCKGALGLWNYEGTL